MDIPKQLTAKRLADGMYFGESPRYWDGKLYVSDMTGQKIYTIDVKTGEKQVFVEVQNQPNGMCFMSDGSLIYSSMFDAKLYKYKDGQHSLYADMTGTMTGYCGDMMIDKSDRVYVDDVGARVLHGEKPCPGRIIIVETDGTVKSAAEGIAFPNAIFISGDGKHLWCAETWGYGLLRYDVGTAGELSNKNHVWAVKDYVGEERVGDVNKTLFAIDGGCIDAEDGMWLSLLGLHKWIRLDQQGRVTHEVKTEGHATACTLGGEDGKTLFLVTNWVPEDSEHIFRPMVEKRTKCFVSSVQVDIGKA